MENQRLKMVRNNTNTNSIIYLIYTNRKAFAKFAYAQWKKFPGTRLVVLDNAKNKINYWDEVGCEHHYIPECTNQSQMYNWFVDKYEGDEHLFLMDDDIELSPNITSIVQYLDDWDVIFLNRVYVTSKEQNKSSIWIRKERQIGAAFLCHNQIWMDTQFDGKAKTGGMYRFHDNIRYRTNKKYLYEPLANYIIHEDNLVMKNIHFEFNLEKVEL